MVCPYSVGKACIVETLFPHIIVMGCLLAASSFFSGSETVLFSLTPDQRRDLRKRRRRTGMAALRLLDDPSSLLVTVLFGNMLVNISYFSISTVLVLRLRREAGTVEASAFGAAALGALILFGEIMPKVVAVNFNIHLVRVVSIPLALLQRLLAPVRAVLVRFVRLFSRALRLHTIREERMTDEELKMLVEMSEQQGVLSRSEREMIAEVVEFGQIRVAEVMTPRVDVPAFDLALPWAELRELLVSTMWKKVPVYEDRMDNILGVVHAKDILLSDGPDVRAHIRKVLFVPELAPVEKVLHQFREKHAHFAVAVDEYGGFAGVVTIEDILGEIVGEIETEFEPEGPLVEQIGPNEYRVAGDLSVREWHEMFQVEVDFPGFDTIGGLVLLLLGHIPHEGESVDFGQLTFTVERMHKRKIETIILKTRNGEAAA